MIDLYLVFFLVGGLVFAGIVWYSMLLQRGRDHAPKEDYIDPLFAELEDTKAKQKNDNLEPVLLAETERHSLNQPSAQKQEASLIDEVVLQSEVAPETIEPQFESRGSNRESLPVVEESAPENFSNTPARQEPKIEEVRNEKVDATIETISESDSIEILDEDATPDIAKPANQPPSKPQPLKPEPLKSESPKPEPQKDRGKSKTFTQKLAEKVAQRSIVKQAKSTIRTAEPTLNSEQPLPVKQATSTSKPKLDKQPASIVTELVARVKNPEPIEQQNLLSLFRTHDFKFHRKVHIYGLNQLTDLWRDIEFEMPSARFVELGVSIQLADRDGAMTEKELHDFQQMTLEFSNDFDAPFEFSMDIDGALKQAQLLDQIGRRYDSMAVLNVVPKTKSGFRMADIESCARDLMMSTDKNGIFMKTEGQKHDVSVLYRLACTDGSGHFGLSRSAIGPVHDLVVYMNVPATTDPEAVFQQMVKDANSLATWLEGKVVDRAGRGMTQRSYSMLMQQISDIAFSMQQDGLIPGDDISKKLF